MKKVDDWTHVTIGTKPVPQRDGPGRSGTQRHEQVRWMLPPVVREVSHGDSVEALTERRVEKSCPVSEP